MIFGDEKINIENTFKENDLIIHQIDKIPNEKMREVVQMIYGDQKEHLKGFLKESLKELMKDEYIGDLPLLNICNEIFEDDELCINRLTLEIKNYQSDN